MKQRIRKENLAGARLCCGARDIIRIQTVTAPSDPDSPNDFGYFCRNCFTGGFGSSWDEAFANWNAGIDERAKALKELLSDDSLSSL